MVDDGEELGSSDMVGRDMVGAGEEMLAWAGLPGQDAHRMSGAQEPVADWAPRPKLAPRGTDAGPRWGRGDDGGRGLLECSSRDCASALTSAHTTSIARMRTP